MRTGVTEAAQALISTMNRWGKIDRQGPGEREKKREGKREQTQLMTVPLPQRAPPGAPEEGD